MATRKKKGQKSSGTGAAKTKPKVNTKKATKPTKAPKVVVPTKKKAPAKKAPVRKPRAAKKEEIIIKSNENFEKFVETIRETKGNELLSNLSEKLENSSTESQDYSSVECDTSMDSQAVEIEDPSTSEIIQQLENLEVQGDQSDVVEIIEFDSIDNVVTVDYISQEEENENSNALSEEVINEDNSSNQDEPQEKEKIIEINYAINEIEQNLSVMMCDNVEPVHIDDIQVDDVKIEKDAVKIEDEIKMDAEDEIKTNANQEDEVRLKDEVVDNNDGIKDEIEIDKEVKAEVVLKIEDEVITERSILEADIKQHGDIEKIVEKQVKQKGKKQNESKSPKPQKKECKKKEKNKNAKSKSKIEDLDDNSIRRSSRIKSISVLKKPSVGHGLVKIKECEIVEIKNETDKVQGPSSTPSNTESNNKPIKVKSRWRRSSELEMNVTNSAALLNANLKIEENVDPNLEKDKQTLPVKDEMVECRLKQFVHLKENSYLTERFICKEAKKMTCDCFLTEEETSRGEMACGEDCLNRLLMIECGSLCQVGDRCANKKFQKGQFAPVEVFNTHKKGLGLRAAANIPYGEFILEYVGEVLNASEFDKRAEEYSEDKNTHYYFMSLRADAIIDATQKGNISRFINHSCEPNAETQKWTVNGELRIGFFSTRTILAGEEVTFDYRFERYGKEAQKCFCEAPSCRGWLGEEPDEDEEGEEEEEEEIEETVEAKSAVLVKSEVSAEPTVEGEETKVEKITEPTPSEVVSVVKKPKPRRKLRKELFEDDQLDEEIEMLITTGLKNQAHTLKLSRLMLRAKEPAQRTKLLKVLRRGELPCRRLFLDYHGLRLMHGYMTDAQHLCSSDKKYDSLRLEMLQTLAVLPIPNKTMLQDSKVLTMVERWSIALSDGSPLDSESNSPKIETESPISTPAPVEVKESITPKPVTEETADNNQMEDFIRKSVGMEEVKSEYSYFTNTSGIALAEEIANIFEDDMYVSSPKSKSVPAEVKPTRNYEEEITALASKLLEAWTNLKEVFRIPKKERIEQMKEHEREANKGYIAGLGLEQYAEKKNESRYRGMQRSRQQDKKNYKSDERSHHQGMLSKHNRRKLFALQVEQQEEDRRRKQRELWRQHERNCMLIGTDPRFTAPFDPTRGFQCIWNPQIGQWQNYPLPPQNQSPMGYGHLPTMNVQASLPNTNVPPPHMTPTSSYPYGMPQMQISGGISLPLPTHATSRSLTHIMSPMPMGRPPLPSSAPPPLPHQMTPPNVSTITTNTHHSQVISCLPPITTSMPPPPTIQQTPPPLPSGVPNLYQTTGYSPQMIVGQTQSPILYQQDKKNEIISMIGDTKFMGAIPPPAKLPPKWKCGKDKYGRPYYYHIRIRKSQWEPPPYEAPPPEECSESSSSESSSSSSDSSSDDSDSDDEIINDSRLLRQVRRHMDKQLKTSTPSKKSFPKNVSMSPADMSSPIVEPTSEIEKADVKSPEPGTSETESSIDKRLKEQFNLLNEETPPAKKKRASLVQEIIISPRTDEDKLQFREDLKRYKENKEMLKKQKEIILLQSKKHIKDKRQKQQQSKAKQREMKYSNSENAKRIKENFRSAMANTVVSALNAHRKSDCKEGRITNTEDFKHLARKLTHFVMLKEMKYISEIEELICSDNVKAKARDYIRKYMSKFGEVYIKRDDEPEHYY